MGSPTRELALKEIGKQDLSNAALDYIDRKIEAAAKAMIEQNTRDLNQLTEAINKSQAAQVAQIDPARNLTLQFAINFVTATKKDPGPQHVLEAARSFCGFLKGDA